MRAGRLTRVSRLSASSGAVAYLMKHSRRAWRREQPVSTVEIKGMGDLEALAVGTEVTVEVQSDPRLNGTYQLARIGTGAYQEIILIDRGINPIGSIASGHIRFNFERETLVSWWGQYPRGEIGTPACRLTRDV